METDAYHVNPETSGDWVGTVASLGAVVGLNGGVGRGGGGAGGGGGGGGASASTSASWHMPYPLGFQVSLTALLMVELVLGFGSNLTVLVLYCSQSDLVHSVSSLVTANLHVLDVALCVLCLPLTLVIVLLPPGPNFATLCCLHEACVTFASIATAINILVISLDRYDISVRPVNRLLTTRRALLLLAGVWLTSVAVFFIPFLEVRFFSPGGEAEGDPAGTHSTSSSSSPSSRSSNHTLLCVGGEAYHMGLGMYYHLALQVPIFFATLAGMLFTYSRILKALNIRIGSHIRTGGRFRGPDCRGRRKKPTTRGAADGGEGGERCTADGSKQLSHPPLIQSSSPTPTATSPPALSSSVSLVPPPRRGGGTRLTGGGAAAAAPGPAPLGVQASVSAIMALRRAVRRHRDRRERQRHVFKMSLVIISTYLGCWAPLTLVNVLILAAGPGDALVSARLWCLALAYGTTVSHPLLYAFTRQTLRRALRAKVKKRVVSLLQVDPSPGGTVIHNSWVENKKSGRQVRLEASEATDRCLAEV
ncbi:G-protein coupled receptor 22-like [Gadus macrocephalus]|uniref:G-protein coupled receptor 22-like n=1 Tax=Gadus macrocephalus TaxID=80720 RepID=UPI0028CBBDB0|nr:G-protein coupled receptor 22-like [Gadus macrocephalus]